MASKEEVASVKKIDAATDERARLAVKEFRKLMPTLSAYVRMMTGKNMPVVMRATGPSATDGRSIFYRPPLALADKAPHDRRTCDTRDPVTSRMVCRACDTRERVLASIYHEIGHNVGGTFDAITERAKITAIEFAIREAGKSSDWAAGVQAKIKNAPPSSTYRSLVSLVNEFLPFLQNSLEDARVDAAMFKVRPGLRAMFKASNSELLTEGVEREDGTRALWRDFPLNAQMIGGMYLKAIGGYNCADYFHPDAVKALDDPVLTQLASMVADVENVAAVYDLSFKVLARFRDLGFCGTPQDPDPEPEPEPEPEESDDDQPDEDQQNEDDSEDEQDESDDGEGDGDGSSDAGEPDPDAVPSEDAGDGDAGDDVESSDEGGDRSGPGQPSPDQDGSGDDGSEEEQVDEESSDSLGEGSGDAPGSGEPRPDEPGGDGSEAGGADGLDELDGADGSGSSDGASAEPDSSAREDEAPGGSDEVQPEGDGTGKSSEASDDNPPGDSEGADAGAPESSEGSVASDQASADEGSDMEGEAVDGAGSEGRESSVDDGQGEVEDSHSQGDDPGSDSERPDMEGLEADSLPGSHDSDGSDSPDDGGDSPGTGASDTSDMGESGEVQAEVPDDSEGSSLGHERTQDTPESTAGGELLDESSDGSDLARESDDGSEVQDAAGSESESEPLEVQGDSEEDPEDDRPELGSVGEVQSLVVRISGHNESDHEDMTPVEKAAIDRAVVQGVYFETASSNIYGVREHYYGKPIEDDQFNYSAGWHVSERAGSKLRKPSYRHLDIPEVILSPALGRMRRALSDNQRGSSQLHRTSGKVNARALGKRAPIGDPRLFKKSILPGKKDYEVFIFMDISGSTMGENLRLMKRAVMAQAHLLHRVGVRFSIYAHTAIHHDFGITQVSEHLGLDMDIYHIKDPDEKWETKVQDRLAALSHGYANLDGHALEYARKLADRSRMTDKIILYYSDGAMPAENHDEELDILTREIRTCKVKGYTLLGVGINTDSPKEHGLDTVQVDGDEDLKNVVDHLGKRIQNK